MSEPSLRDATLLLQAQSRVLEGCLTALAARDEGRGRDAWRGVAEGVLRVVVAVMTGAPIHEPTLRQLHASASVDDRARALDAILDELIRLGVSPSSTAAVASSARTTLSIAHGLVDDTPRPSLVTAMADVDATPVAPPPPAPTALLRLRATSAAAAHALHGLPQRSAPQGDDVITLPAAPDEVLVLASAPLAESVPRLVRLASMWIRALDDEIEQHIVGALVAIDERGGSRALREACVRAGHAMRRAGLLHLDERAFAAAPGLAEHPTWPRHVIPSAAFGHDRWQLSALVARAPVVGRTDELGEVALRLTRPSGDACLTVLHGPAGIGKASFLRRALVDAGYGDARAPVVWGSADPLQPTPYAPIVAMLHALAGTHIGTLHAAARLRALLVGLADALPADVGRELLSLEKILAYLMGAADDDDDEELEREVEDLSPRALRVAVRRAVLLVVEGLRARAGGRRAVLVISGADAIDAPTVDLLTFLSRRLGGDLAVFMLCSSRMRLARPLVEAFDVSRVELRPLDATVSLEVMSALVDGACDPSTFTPIIEKARGAPLHMSQALRFVIESGLVAHDGQRFFGMALKPSAIPARVERVIAARVARLPDVARRTLGFAAVLGNSFMPAAVEVVGVRAGIPREDIARALHLLLETGFLVRSAPRPAAPVFAQEGAASEDPVLAFEHPLIRTVVENELEQDERERVHGLAAEALLALLPSGTRAIAGQLARHFRVAHERTRALHHLSVAVRRAVRLHNRAGAITMAKEGLALAGDGDAERQFAFQLELERALDQGNDRETHKTALKELVRIAERTQDPRRQGQALQRVARFNVFGGDHEKAEAALARAIERLRLVDDKRGQAQALRVLGLARFEQRRFDAALDALKSARALIKPDDARALGILDHQLGLMHLEAGDAIVALEHLMDALQHKQRSGDPSGECACLAAIADVYARLGRLHTAAMLLERAVDLAGRIGDEAGRAEATKGLAEVLLALGDASRAKDLALAAQRLARTLELERLERTSMILVARAELMRGDAATAEHIIDGVRRRVDEKRDPFAAMEAALVSALAKLARAARAQSSSARERLQRTALERAKLAAQLGDAHGYASGQVLGTAAVGAALHAMGDKGGALLYAQRASELVDERRATGLPIEDVLLTHARALHAAGDLDDAAVVAERAMHILETRAARLPSELRRTFWDVQNRTLLRALHGHLMATRAPTSAATA